MAPGFIHSGLQNLSLEWPMFSMWMHMSFDQFRWLTRSDLGFGRAPRPSLSSIRLRCSLVLEATGCLLENRAAVTRKWVLKLELCPNLARLPQCFGTLVHLNTHVKVEELVQMGKQRLTRLCVEQRVFN